MLPEPATVSGLEKLVTGKLLDTVFWSQLARHLVRIVGHLADKVVTKSKSTGSLRAPTVGLQACGARRRSAIQVLALGSHF